MAKKLDHIKEMDLYDYGKPNQQISRVLNNDYIKHVVKELHDKYKPEAIFLTISSGLLFGWAIKEMWETTWPGEDIPKFLTIDVHNIHHNKTVGKSSARNKHWKETTGLDTRKHPHKQIYECKNLEDYYKDLHIKLKKVKGIEQKSKDKVLDKLKKYHITGNIAVVDEYRGENWGSSLGEKTLPLFVEHPNQIERFSATLHDARAIIKDAMEKTDNHNTIITTGLKYNRAEHGPYKRVFDEETKEVVLKREPLGKNHELALQQVNKYKSWGHTLGTEMRNEMEAHRRKKKLETIIGAVMGVLAFGLLLGGTALDSITSGVIGTSTSHGTLLSITMIATLAISLGLLLHAQHKEN